MGFDPAGSAPSEPASRETSDCPVDRPSEPSQTSAMILRLLAMLLIATGFGQAATIEPVLPTALFKNLAAGKSQTVVTYGTSLTEAGPWVPLLQTWFNERYRGLVTVVNGAKSGQNSAWGLANVQKQVVDRHPDLVFVEFAINDAVLRFDITPEKGRANLDGILAAIRAGNPQVEIVLMTMNAALDAEPRKNAATTRPKLAEYYANYTACAVERKLPIIDNYPAWRALAERDPATFLKYAPDGLHPNATGIKAITWPNIEAFLAASAKAAKR